LICLYGCFHSLQRKKTEKVTRQLDIFELKENGFRHARPAAPTQRKSSDAVKHRSFGEVETRSDSCSPARNASTGRKLATLWKEQQSHRVMRSVVIGENSHGAWVVTGVVVTSLGKPETRTGTATRGKIIDGKNVGRIPDQTLAKLRYATLVGGGGPIWSNETIAVKALRFAGENHTAVKMHEYTRHGLPAESITLTVTVGSAAKALGADSSRSPANATVVAIEFLKR
jgi:hypothetical protein